MWRTLGLALLATACGLPASDFAQVMGMTLCDRIEECVRPFDEPAARQICEDDFSSLTRNLMNEANGWAGYDPAAGRDCVTIFEVVPCRDFLGADGVQCDVSDDLVLSLTFEVTPQE